MKKNVLLEFKRTSDYSESYYRDMWRVSVPQHTPILTGLRALSADRGWEVDVVPLVADNGQLKKMSDWNPLRSLGLGK